MADEISQHELDQLLAAARASRKAPVHGARAAFKSAAVSYDFKRPQRVKKDQARGLESIHEQFCRMFAATLSSSMRMVVDVDLAYSDQLLYSEFIASLPSPCTVYRFVIEPFGGHGIMSFSPELLMAVVERSFGGQGRAMEGVDARALTQIEMKVVSRMVSRILADLEATWESVAAVQIAEVALEVNPEFIQIAAPGDGVLVVAFEANSKSTSGMVHLCYPLTTLDPLLGKVFPTAGGRRAHARRADDSGEKQRQLLSKTKVPVQVQVASGSLPLNELAGLKIGDVVKLDTEKGDPAVVFIGDRPKYLARPGLQGRRRAVQIVEEIHPDDEDRYR